MATEKFIAFDENGDIFLIKGRILRYLPDTVAAAVKTSIRSALSVPASAEGLTPANNLDDVSSAETSRDNLAVPSDDELAEAVGPRIIGPSLRFKTNDYLEIADNDKLSFTDSVDDLPGTITFWMYFPSNASTRGIIVKFGSAAPNQEWSAYLDSSDRLNFSLRDSGGDFNGVYSTTGLSAYQDKWVFCAITYGGSGPNSASSFANAHTEMTLYVNGESVATTQNASGTYDGMPNSSQAVNIGRRGTSDYFEGRLREVRLFNRELSAAEVKEVMHGPLSFADEWGGAVGGIETLDASAGTDGWAAIAGTAAGNVDSIGGQDDNLQLTVDTANSSHYLYKIISGLVVGRRYRLDADVYISSANSHLDSVAFGNAITPTISATPTLDTWTRVSGEVTATGTNLRILARDGGVDTFQDAGGNDVLYVRNLRITEIGCIADFRAEDFNPSADKWVDRSSNDFVATNNGANLVGNRRHISASTLDLSDIPTSSAGLSSGEVWSNSGVLTLVS